MLGIAQHVSSPNLHSQDSSPNGLTDFEGLVRNIKQVLGTSSGLDSSEVDVPNLMRMIRSYDATANPAEWSPYAFLDPNSSYTRNGVDDINSKANLLILVWTPGKGSAIHDHANAHCIVKVLKGTLRETLYHQEKEGQRLTVKRVSDYKTNEVSYMSDELGLHKMENLGTEPVVTLHLYTPPYAAKFGCNTYDEFSGAVHHSTMSLYSDHGVIRHD